MSLTSGSITIINPNDERPTPRDGNPYNTQYLHGNVSVTKNKLLFALVFRVVDTVGDYDVNDRLVNHNIHHSFDNSNMYNDYDPIEYQLALRGLLSNYI